MPTTAPTAIRRPEPPRESATRPLPRRIDVQTLLGEDRLVMIEHGDNHYFLRMTRNQKLILTK